MSARWSGNWRPTGGTGLSCERTPGTIHPSMKTLGIDHGEKRLGFAVSDPDGSMAFPLRVVTIRDEDEALLAAMEVFKETESRRIVVGLPLNMNGSKGPSAEKAIRFASRLSEAAGVAVETWDERLSTCEAERVLLAADLSRARRKMLRDKMAAQIILQSYLDSRQNVGGRAGGGGEAQGEDARSFVQEPEPRKLMHGPRGKS